MITICKICRHDPCDTRCPNYEPPIVDHYCSICDEGILDGEEYVTNDNGDMAHTECLDIVYDVLNWLDCDVRIMEGQ